MSDSSQNVPNGTPYLSIEDIVIIEENHQWKVSAKYKCKPVTPIDELSGTISILLDTPLPMTPNLLRSQLRRAISKQIEQAWTEAEAAQERS